MPGQKDWANLFPAFGKIDEFNDRISDDDRASGVELVEVIDDDAASSVCLDEQDIDVGLEDALKVVNDTSAKMNLSDYEMYTRKVAEDIIARERVTHRRLVATPTRTPYGYVELLEKHEEEEDKTPPSAYKGSIFNEGDVESLATLDIDSIEDPLIGAPRSGLKRQIRPRDLQLITLGGYIGLAFFQDTAKGLWLSGPVYIFITFLMSGVMFYFMMASVAEMVAFVPHDAGYTGIINTVVDRSVAVAFGIFYWIQACLRVPYEVILTVTLFSTFPILNQPDYSSMVWLTSVLVVVIGSNFCYVRVWGRLTALSAFVSVACIATLNLYNLLMDTGHIAPMYEYIGFKYWTYGTDEGVSYGPFKPFYGDRQIGGAIGGLLQFWSAWVTSAYAFTGLDVIYVPTAEIRNPRRTVPQTMKILPWRIGLVFALTLFIVLLVANSGDWHLGAVLNKNAAESGTCGIKVSQWQGFTGIYMQSPWIVAFLEQKVCYAAFAVVAFFIYIGCLAAAGHLFVASRALHGMGQIGILWRWVSYTSRNGVLFPAVMLSSCFALTAYMTAGANAGQYYMFLSRWVMGSLWLMWAILSFTYLKFYRVIKCHPSIDRDGEDYPYKAPLQPYASIFCGTICLLFALFSSVPDCLSRKGVNVESIIGLYCPIVLFIGVFVLHKWYFKTKFIKDEDVNIEVYKHFMDRQEWEEDRVYSKSFRGAIWQAQQRVKKQWDRRAKPYLRSRHPAKEV